jgi:hypothetical protein
MGDVLGIFSARKLQCRVRVPALVEVAVPQRRFHQQPSPVAFAEVGQVKGCSVFIEEHKVTAQLRASALLLKLINHRRQHVNLAFAGCDLGQANPRKAMDATPNPELLAIEVDIFPMQR